jgi:putative restriction endonuclease
MLSDIDDRAFRESAFAWLRAQLLVKPALSRADLALFPFQGRNYRLLGPQTGIWRPKELSSAISFSTAYVTNPAKRPYEDEVGPDGLLRYKWRGTDRNQADNVALRTAMERGDDLIWFVGVGFEGVSTQVYKPIFPVRLVAEEPGERQFVVSLEAGQRHMGGEVSGQVLEIAKKYNEQVVKVRYHQPIFRSQVLRAYEQRCAICRLPFTQLLDAAHIHEDAKGGIAHVTNGLALCKIHHGAFDSQLLGISADYTIHISDRVLKTFDGPTLQHSLKEMNGKKLGQVPDRRDQQPSKELLAERFDRFKQAS